MFCSIDNSNSRLWIGATTTATIAILSCSSSCHCKSKLLMFSVSLFTVKARMDASKTDRTGVKGHVPAVKASKKVSIWHCFPQRTAGSATYNTHQVGNSYNS